jgi:dihydroorotate dehydrogenase (NAD+) catalytic subunit
MLRHRMDNLAINFAGVPMQSPLIAAAGTSGYVDELAGVMDVRCLGAITSKSITPEPREGHPPWRVIELPGTLGMLNAIGLANVGVERFVAEYVPRARNLGTVLIGSIAGGSVQDYVDVALAFDACDELPMVEINVSCPNTADGLQFGEHPESLRQLLAAVRPALAKTKMLVKLSPNVGDIVRMADVAVSSGADGLTLINTVSALAIDVETRTARLSRGAGGMSGPAIHPIAVRMVRDVYTKVAQPAGVPIVGLGGVMRWEDAAELVLAGATAVGIGTGVFVSPRTPGRILKGLARWVERQGCTRVSELTGKVVAP